jgi:hypothetical protein
MVSVEAYYRVTYNKVERIQSLYDENVILHTVDNVGTDYALGVEFMSDLRLSTWWNVNCILDFYQYRLESDLYDEHLSQEDFNWSGRLNNELQLTKSTKVQFNGRYRSASFTSQGSREGFLTTDAAVKQEFLNKKLSFTLQVRDVFGTGKRESTSEGENFRTYMSASRKTPIVMLSINYVFNNYKPERRREEVEPEFEGGEDL